MDGAKPSLHEHVTLPLFGDDLLDLLAELRGNDEIP